MLLAVYNTRSTFIPFVGIFIGIILRAARGLLVSIQQPVKQRTEFKPLSLYHLT
jgi:hypothetical protein